MGGRGGVGNENSTSLFTQLLSSVKVSFVGLNGVHRNLVRFIRFGELGGGYPS